MARHQRPINPQSPSGIHPVNVVVAGVPIPKTKRIQIFSSDEWEQFTEEWASSLESEYKKVVRFAGAGDQGLDVVGFIAGESFESGWDNYQCKHYDNPLKPSDVWVEIGKIIYYSFIGEYPPPRKHYFVASNDTGTKLGKLLADPKKLKSETKKNWATHCETKISSKFVVKLEGAFLKHLENFDFSIFSSKSSADLITGHAKTPFHVVRFGGGFPRRPEPVKPPSQIERNESRYIEQLLEAYGDHRGTKLAGVAALDLDPTLKHDFLRQRERFYNAESLRNFARDTVPAGTYEDLQQEIYAGVVDTCEAEHHDGFAKLKAAMSQAANVQPANILSTVTKIQDKQGICHQLANIDQIVWVSKK